MAKNWEPGLAEITGPEDWDRAIVHLWGDNINEFKRAFPHLLKAHSSPNKSEARLYDFPKSSSDSNHNAAA